MNRGDHLYVDYPGFSHHGIYCGDGTVIHFSKNNNFKISRTSLAEFAQGKIINIIEHYKSEQPSVVFNRAVSQLGKSGYSLFDNNCEHFATWCKTGRKESAQVRTAFAIGGGASATAAVSGLAGLSSAAGITSGLAAVGGTVGGGMAAGVAIVAAPAVGAAVIGYGAYRLWKWLAD
jgi:hypothetical protein